MAHFAEIDANNCVKRTIVAEQDFINSGAVGDSFNWIQTSYSGSFRGHYAGEGFTYDKSRDAFIPPQPHLSWTLNESTYAWDPPVAYPDDGKSYTWDEAQLAWVEM